MTARLAGYHAAHLLDEGMPCDAELISAKLLNVESSLDSARTAMEVHAAHGLYPGSHIERFLRDANHIYAPAGTSDVQRIRLAEVALGTYREQWSARFADQLRASSGLLNGVARAADEPISHETEERETAPSRWWRR
jgi:acyl-CoA dehydrogenase